MTLYGEIEGNFEDEMSTLVHLEVEAIFDVNPLQILNRYDPGPHGSSMKNRRGGDLNLQSISKRAAHIKVLHWRVWAPILYNQFDPTGNVATASMLRRIVAPPRHSVQPGRTSAPNRFDKLRRRPSSIAN